MAMGRRKPELQGQMFIAVSDLPAAAGHPFYEKLNQALRAMDFDRRVEEACRKFYQEEVGRPSIPPGVYFRLLLIGYFEGLDSERGIAWRSADSLSVRSFIGYALDEVNYGVSPGDGGHPAPYAYVGPWTQREGPFWNAPFGAARPAAQLPTVTDVVEFFMQGRSQAHGA